MIKPAELKALKHLPEKTKDRILPCFLLRPWLTAKRLERAIEVIEDSFGDRKFFLDIDYDYISNREGPLHPSLLPMVEGTKTMMSYFDFIENCPSVIPVVRLVDEFTRVANWSRQLERINRLGRGAGLRFYGASLRQSNVGILDTLGEFVSSRDLTYFVDTGWIASVDVGKRLAERALTEIGTMVLKRDDADATFRPRVVLSGSSFPKSFSEVNGLAFFENANRRLFLSERSSRGNLLDLKYGDWASARPKDRGFAITIPPRVDYPIAEGWLVARKPETWDYQEAAKAVVSDSRWNRDLELWGANLISATANGLSSLDCIDDPRKNVQARANIHLQIFAYLDQPERALDTDDEWPADL